MNAWETGDLKAVDAGTRKEMIDKAYELAYRYEREYGNCPQCVIAAVGDALEVEYQDIFKAAQALSGGAAMSTLGTCGALSGGLMMISSKYGRDRENFASKRFVTASKLGKQLVDRFVGEFGSPLCKDVQTRLMGRAFNMWDREDFKEFEAAGGHDDECPSVSGKVASWTSELLFQQADRDVNR